MDIKYTKFALSDIGLTEELFMMKEWSKQQLVTFFILLCVAFFACFRIPGPLCLRPGHPEWPVGWIAGLSLDSLESQIPLLRKHGITCIGISVKGVEDREKEIYVLCQRNSLKIFLQMEPFLCNSDELNSSTFQNSGINPKIQDLIHRQISEALTPWIQLRNGQFPIDIVPAIQFDINPIESLDSDSIIRMVQHAVDSIAPGMLVFVPVDGPEILSYSKIPGSHPDPLIIGPKKILQPHIRINLIPSHVRQITKMLISADSLAKAGNALFIPKIQISLIEANQNYSAEIDRLLNLLQSITPDAVIWENVEYLSNDIQEKIFNFHQVLRMRTDPL
ncbi:hypothetical protein ACFL4L_00545 [bacterium]